MAVNKLAIILGTIILCASGFFSGKEVFQSESFKNGALIASLFPVNSFEAGTLVDEIPLRTDMEVVEEKSASGLQNNIVAAQGRTAGNIKTQKTAVAVNSVAKTAVKQKKQATTTETEEPESPVVMAQPPVPARPVQKEPVFCLETGAPPANDPVIINEVAWMGDAVSAQREWIELKNISSAVIPIGGWQLFDKSRTIKTVIRNDAVLSAGGTFVLARQGKDKNWTDGADAAFSGTINNSDEELTLFDAGCRPIDKVSALPAWPAGNNETKATMERATDFSWYTSSIPGGTPKIQNSPRTIVTAETSVAEEPESGGASQQLQQTPEAPPPQSPSETPQQPARVLISEVMAGMEGNADFDFIELYNAGDTQADLTGWTIKKKSSSGSESSFVAISRLEGKSIQPKKFFLLGNETGYTGEPILDVVWPHSYSLAYTNNAVVIYNASGEKTDEASWTEILKGQSYERAAWTSNEFTIRPSPSPQNSQTP
ncbi:MAG: lamin tail domain-containing protein [Candidatus Jorgensenbacteria bacterium]|nr:lamin tail domain-containing protein [Candidatus Jorgensenbacteria bacterium]